MEGAQSDSFVIRGRNYPPKLSIEDDPGRKIRLDQYCYLTSLCTEAGLFNVEEIVTLRMQHDMLHRAMLHNERVFFVQRFPWSIEQIQRIAVRYHLAGYVLVNLGGTPVELDNVSHIEDGFNIFLPFVMP